ncbi:hypothetical protein Barb4_02540 [Bacteroidales bacterium Barb4]|nr:hypothetical protein Barb4_02540 [Bacteroidales bacterium Barb4]
MYLYRSFSTLLIYILNPTFRFAACGAEIFCPFQGVCVTSVTTIFQL